MDQLDTQDIRDATQVSNDGCLFFLLIATPNNPPKQFHKEVVQPYLYRRGWKKISYKNTGFRALYFFHDQTEDFDSFGQSPTICKTKCPRCEDINDNTNQSNGPSPKKLKKCKTEPSEVARAVATSCSECSSWTALQRASYDRAGLKKEVQNYKDKLNGSFEVHIVLSKPDDDDEFLDIASQTGSVV